jgi:hypothetical protein
MMNGAHDHAMPREAAHGARGEVRGRRVIERVAKPVRDLLDAHEASIDAAVMRVRTNPEARDAGRHYVERARGARA